MMSALPPLSVRTDACPETEPDEQLKVDLGERTEHGPYDMVESVQPVRDTILSAQALEECREQALRGYESGMNNVRMLTQDDFNRQLRTEMSERKRALGMANTNWLDIARQQQTDESEESDEVEEKGDQEGDGDEDLKRHQLRPSSLPLVLTSTSLPSTPVSRPNTPSRQRLPSSNYPLEDSDEDDANEAHPPPSRRLGNQPHITGATPQHRPSSGYPLLLSLLPQSREPSDIPRTLAHENRMEYTTGPALPPLRRNVNSFGSNSSSTGLHNTNSTQSESHRGSGVAPLAQDHEDTVTNSTTLSGPGCTVLDPSLSPKDNWQRTPSAIRQLTADAILSTIDGGPLFSINHDTPREAEAMKENRGEAHTIEEEVRRSGEGAGHLQNEAHQAVVAAKRCEAQKEEEVERRVAEAKKREAEAQRKEEEVQLREHEVRRKEEEVQRREEEARKREEVIRQKESVANMQAHAALRRGEDARRRELLAVQKEEGARRFEENVRKKAEEVRRKEEEMTSRMEELDYIKADYEQKLTEFFRRAQRWDSEQVRRPRPSGVAGSGPRVTAGNMTKVSSRVSDLDSLFRGMSEAAGAISDHLYDRPPEGPLSAPSHGTIPASIWPGFPARGWPATNGPSLLERIGTNYRPEPVAELATESESESSDFSGSAASSMLSGHYTVKSVVSQKERINRGYILKGKVLSRQACSIGA
ncbi:hypothetical protein BC834DRAFT_335637 [Gloeopeniophorella convolvens]|nr:hypothetical protein BC834DRAFT_335637 [Gloeopeniophorella convolvens]